MNALQQQGRFDDFVSEFNEERPHEALAMRTPAELYTPSSKACQGLPEVKYPFHDRDILVTACGRICMHRKKINVSTVLAGQRLAITEVDDGIWLVSFMHYDLGYIDLEQRTLQTIDNPFGTRLSPMSQGQSVTHVSGPYTKGVAVRDGFEPSILFPVYTRSRRAPSTTRPPHRRSGLEGGWLDPLRATAPGLAGTVRDHRKANRPGRPGASVGQRRNPLLERRGL